MSGQLALDPTASLTAVTAPDTAYINPLSVMNNTANFIPDLIKKFPVSAEGTFFVDVPSTTGDAVIAAFDSKAANKIQGLKGVLSVGDASGSPLKFRTGNSQPSIDAGVLQGGSGEFKSAKTTDEVSSSFTMDVEKIKETAKIDDFAKHLINIVANY